MAAETRVIRNQDKAAIWWTIDSFHYYNTDFKKSIDQKKLESYRIYLKEVLLKLRKAISTSYIPSIVEIANVKLDHLHSRLYKCRSIWGLEDCAKKMDGLIDKFFRHDPCKFNFSK
jgi:hypothetical protein